MTEHRTLNTVIHAAVRRDLRRFTEALAHFADWSRARADQLTAAWEHFSYQLHRHHEDEETFFWPAFEQLGVDTSLVEDLQGEHDQMVAAPTTADATMKTFALDTSVANTGEARRAVVELGWTSQHRGRNEAKNGSALPGEDGVQMEPLGTTHSWPAPPAAPMRSKSES